MNNYINYRDKDITDVGEKDRKLSRPDGIFISCMVAIMVIIYIATDVCFEMYTNNTSLAEDIGCAIPAFFIITYFCVRYIGLKRFAAYMNIIIGTALLSVLLASNLQNIKLLYYAAQTSTVSTQINIDNVKKNMVKHSFMGSYIFVKYDHKQLRFESSRVNYYALKDAHSMLVNIGKAGADNYYITKVQWGNNQKAVARKQYWSNWLNGALITVSIFVGLIVLVVIAIFFKEKLGIKKPNFLTSATPLQLVLIWLGCMVAIVVLLALGLYTYMLIRYGRIGY